MSNYKNSVYDPSPEKSVTMEKKNSNELYNEGTKPKKNLWHSLLESVGQRKDIT
jgi:hypothetical protein